MRLPKFAVGFVLPTALVYAASIQRASKYLDWKSFKGDGVNIGGWLIQEPFIDTDWWATNCGDADDEWTCCANLGDQCGPVLEERYSTWVTPADIDTLASVDVKVLRIPTTYAAWIELPGSELYHGNQAAHLQEIASYAIKQYDMHIIIDLHGLPGGINNGSTGERTGALNWFYNETALDWSLKAIEAVVDFVQETELPQSFTIEPVNEPMDNPIDSGFPSALSENAALWLLKFYNAVIERVAAVNPLIPVMLSDVFKGVDYWAPSFAVDQNIVFDLHYFYFSGRPTGPNNVTDFICSDAKFSQSRTFPTFTGEWSIETLYNNTLSARETILNAGLHAFSQATAGSAYWASKVTGTWPLNGEGTRRDYWSFEKFIELGFVHPESASGFCN